MNNEWVLYKNTADGSGSYDFYALDNHGVASSKAGHYTLKSAAIESWRNGGPWWDRVGFPKPEGDIRSSSCGGVNLGITAGAGPEISLSGSYCPKEWDVTYYTDRTHFRNTWRGNACVDDKHVEFSMGVKTNQGSGVTFGLDMGFYVAYDPAIGCF